METNKVIVGNVIDYAGIMNCMYSTSSSPIIGAFTENPILKMWIEKCVEEYIAEDDMISSVRFIDAEMSSLPLHEIENRMSEDLYNKNESILASVLLDCKRRTFLNVCNHSITHRMSFPDILRASPMQQKQVVDQIIRLIAKNTEFFATVFAKEGEYVSVPYIMKRCKICGHMETYSCEYGSYFNHLTAIAHVNAINSGHSFFGEYIGQTELD